MMLQKTETTTLDRLPALVQALKKAEMPDEVLQIEAEIAGIESWMEKNGLGISQMRPVNEFKMRARRQLGHLLTLILRGTPGPKDVYTEYKQLSFTGELKRLHLNPRTAYEAQQIKALPEIEFNRVLREFEKANALATFGELGRLGRPYWAQINRKFKHKAIRTNCREIEGQIGPFPLIYADPPWKWGHFGVKDQENEKGKGRTPDQHYPTLSHDEICGFKVQGKYVREIITRDAALFMWCTSSNIESAIEVMGVWGFTFKASAVWVKMKDGKLQRGMGLVFRNAHEVLLYGTRGDMPGPQHQPPSVFIYPRGKHSAKPPEIRTAIEKMYPDFDAKTRLELFAIGENKGWTGYGYEA
jgi:N6-adenosine-specific RNA methylase IME4